MELELGFKITRTRDDITSTADFQIAKDRAGPLFLSRETDTMFILTGHLKGYRKENVDVQINEDGTRVCISGEKPVQEMVVRRWMMFKKEVEIRGFRKVFKIPAGVVLDKIKAKYNELDSILTIFMPKKVKGIRGISIEEVKEEQEQKVADEIPQETQKEKEILDEGEKSQEMNVETSGDVKDIREEISGENEMGTEIVAEKLPPAEEDNGEAQKFHEKECTVETMPGAVGSDLLNVEKMEKSEVTQEVIEATTQIPENEESEREQPPQKFAGISHETSRGEDEREPEDIAPETDDVGKDSVKEAKLEEKIEPEVRKADEDVHAPEEKIEYEGGKQIESQKEDEGVPSITEAPLEPENQESKAEIQENEQIESSSEEAAEEEEKATGQDVRDEIRPQIQAIQEVKVPEDKGVEDQKPQDTGSSKEKKRRSKRLCPPLVISGSALLVTLIVIVIHFIRARKR